jgi:hypothetical protein
MSRYAGERVPQRFQASEKGNDLPVQKWHFLTAWGCWPTVTSLAGSLGPIFNEINDIPQEESRERKTSSKARLAVRCGFEEAPKWYNSCRLRTRIRVARHESGCDNGVAAALGRPSRTTGTSGAALASVSAVSSLCAPSVLRMQLRVHEVCSGLPLRDIQDEFIPWKNCYI